MIYWHFLRSITLEPPWPSNPTRVRPLPSSTKRRLQNSSVTGARINARSALILASTYEGLRPPVHYPQGLTFSCGIIRGKVWEMTQNILSLVLLVRRKTRVGLNVDGQILHPAPVDSRSYPMIFRALYDVKVMDMDCLKRWCKCLWWDLANDGPLIPTKLSWDLHYLQVCCFWIMEWLT